MTKKNIFVLVYFFFFLCYNYAQEKTNYCKQWKAKSSTISEADSILAYNQRMIGKVNDLCKTKIYLNSGFTAFEAKRDMDYAILFYDKAIKIAKSIEATDVLTKTYTYKSRALSQKKLFSEAILNLNYTRELLDPNRATSSWNYYYNAFASVYSFKGDFYKALQYADSSVAVAKNNNNDIELAVSYHNQGLYNYRLSRYEEASRSLLNAIKLKESQKEPDNIARTYYLMGRCYVDWNQYEIAEKYLNKSIPFARQEGNSYLEILIYSYLADCYIKQDRSEKALKTIDYTLQLAQKLNSKGRVFQAFNQKGWLYLENFKQYDKAEKYFKEAYEVAKTINLAKDDYLHRSYTALVTLYLKKGDYKKAKEFLWPLEEAINKTGIVSNKQELYTIYSKYYEKVGQPSLALKYIKKYYGIKDSIENQFIQTKIVDLEKEYDTKKKELVISKLNYEKQEQERITAEAKFKQNLYLLTALFLLVLLVVAFFGFRRLKAQKKELTAADQFKSRLFSIIAHDLRGILTPLQRSGDILKHHIDLKNYKRVVVLSKELEKNFKYLSNLLDNLLNWSLEQINGYIINPEQISIANHLTEIIDGYKQEADYKNTSIRLLYEKDISIYFDEGVFHIIFRNLIGNAVKFTENGNIKIEFKKEFNSLIYTVTDTGVGMHKEHLENLFKEEKKHTTLGTHEEKGTGLGLSLVYRFIKMHKGDIQIFSEKDIGTSFILRMPI